MIKKMRGLILALSLALTAVVGVAVAPPSSAGQDYWSADPCRYDVLWMNQSGVYGTTYFWSVWDQNPQHYHFVGDRTMDAYSAWGWQCGALGAPITGLVYANGHYVQYFQNGAIYLDLPANCWRISYPAYGWYNVGCW